MSVEMISLNREKIEALIDLPKAALAIEEAYRASSRGEVNLPPVGHIAFPQHDADCHIKYGHLLSTPTFAIKIATGFPNNTKLGLRTGNGLVLVMSAETGEVRAVLHDEMMLTDIRTGLGGAIASRLAANKDSERILVLGTGQQALRQIEAHSALLSGSISFELWGRNRDRVRELIAEIPAGIDISVCENLASSVRRADIIITATGAKSPLIKSDWVMPGTHITAVGADAPGKQELDVELVARADVLLADLTSQCSDHGELSHAVQTGAIEVENIIEIGTALEHNQQIRKTAKQITIADLTGVAAQDIAIANTVLEVWNRNLGEP